MGALFDAARVTCILGGIMLLYWLAEWSRLHVLPVVREWRSGDVSLSDGWRQVTQCRASVPTIGLAAIWLLLGLMGPLVFVHALIAGYAPIVAGTASPTGVVGAHILLWVQALTIMQVAHRPRAAVALLVVVYWLAMGARAIQPLVS